MPIPAHLRLEFVTPDRAIVHEDVDEVEIPGEEGYFGVLPGHAPLLAALKPGAMWYRIGAEKHFAFVDGKHDEIPEQAFYMQGGIEDVLERSEQMQKAAA